MNDIQINSLITVLFFMVAAAVFVKVMNNQNNDLDWYHLFSSGAKDGKTYADWNKIGQGCGVIVATWMPFLYINTNKADAMGLAAVMGVSLLYLGGVSAYSTTLRSKNNDVKNIAP